QIFWHETLSLVFVHAIKREHQELTEDVTVAIKSCVNEVQNVRPATAIDVRPVDGIAVIFFIGFDPELSEHFRCKTLFLSFRKCRFLESGERLLYSRVCTTC